MIEGHKIKAATDMKPDLHYSLLLEQIDCIFQPPLQLDMVISTNGNVLVTKIYGRRHCFCL